jgi:hypothetical protein
MTSNSDFQQMVKKLMNLAECGMISLVLVYSTFMTVVEKKVKKKKMRLKSNHVYYQERHNYSYKRLYLAFQLLKI